VSAFTRSSVIGGNRYFSSDRLILIMVFVLDQMKLVATRDLAGEIFDLAIAANSAKMTTSS